MAIFRTTGPRTEEREQRDGGERGLRNSALMDLSDPRASLTNVCSCVCVESHCMELCLCSCLALLLFSGHDKCMTPAAPVFPSNLCEPCHSPSRLPSPFLFPSLYLSVSFPLYCSLSLLLPVSLSPPFSLSLSLSLSLSQTPG